MLTSTLCRLIFLALLILNILAAVTFKQVEGVFSDACNKAIVFGKDTILKPDWKRLFEPEEIVASVRRIT